MSHQIVFTFWLIWLFFFFPFLCICLPAYIDCCCVVVFVVVFLFWFVIFNCFSWEGSVRLCCYPFREKCGNEDTVYAICGPILSPGMGYCGLLMVRQGCKRKKEGGWVEGRYVCRVQKKLVFLRWWMGRCFIMGLGSWSGCSHFKLSAALGLAKLCRKVMGRQGPTPVRAVTKVRYCACGYHNWTRLEWGPWDIMFGPFWWPEESIYFLASLPCYPSQALLNYTSLWRVAFHFCMRLQKS